MFHISILASSGENDSSDLLCLGDLVGACKIIRSKIAEKFVEDGRHFGANNKQFKKKTGNVPII